MSGVGITYLWFSKEFPPFIRLEGKRGYYEVYTPERTCHNDSLKRGKGVFVCSKCGVYLDISDMAEEDMDVFYEPRYCPNCGRRVIDDRQGD